MSAALTRLVENLDLPPKEAGEAILAYRAEVLREAAAEIRRGAVHDVLKNCTPCATHRFDADLIDPDTP